CGEFVRSGRPASERWWRATNMAADAGTASTATSANTVTERVRGGPAGDAAITAQAATAPRPTTAAQAGGWPTTIAATAATATAATSARPESSARPTPTTAAIAGVTASR